MGPLFVEASVVGASIIGQAKGPLSQSVMPHPSEPESMGPPPSLRGLNHRRLSRRGPNRMMMMYRGLTASVSGAALGRWGLSRFGLSRRGLSRWGLSRCIGAPVVRASAVGAPVVASLFQICLLNLFCRFCRVLFIFNAEQPGA
jgi:hypothetical protein